MPRIRANAACVCALIAVALAAHAQPSPPIELADLFGVRTLDERVVREVLPFREGDTITGTENK